MTDPTTFDEILAAFPDSVPDSMPEPPDEPLIKVTDVWDARIADLERALAELEERMLLTFDQLEHRVQVLECRAAAARIQ